MGDRVTIVDAFAGAPFAGNPAAVCFPSEARHAGWMQAVAGELNLSATAFVRQAEDGFDLRWFSPRSELSLCGHGTLAAAHVVWQEGIVGAEVPLRFRSPSGPLVCSRRDGWIAMDFPAEPPATVADPPPALLPALGVRPRSVARNRLDFLVELDSAADVRAAAPDLAALAAVDTRGVILTAAADSADHDFVSRFFAPAVGIAEDPATGSAHCGLAPYWAPRLGKHDLIGVQASLRGAIIRVRLRGDRVELRGQAVTVLRGELAV